MIWSKEDSKNLSLLTRNSLLIAVSLAKMAQLSQAELEDIELIMSINKNSSKEIKIEYSEYNPEKEYEEEQEELLEKRLKIENETNQFWAEDEMNLEDLG